MALQSHIFTLCAKKTVFTDSSYSNTAWDLKGISKLAGNDKKPMFPFRDQEMIRKVQ